jgi:hypothetical protein
VDGHRCRTLAQINTAQFQLNCHLHPRTAGIHFSHITLITSFTNFVFTATRVTIYIKVIVLSYNNDFNTVQLVTSQQIFFGFTLKR